jgi:hypothetical protein
MQPLSNPPWYRRWSAILAGVIVLAAIAALLGWRGLQQVATPSPTSTSVATATTVAEPATTRTSATTSRLASDILWRAEGSDTHRGRVFRAPERWRIIWSFDCSDFPGGRGNFKITGEGAFSARVDIQAFRDQAEGSELVRGGGTGRLVIDSVCERWEVQAVRA